MRYIYSIRKTFQGAWIITGTVGAKQFLGYSKREAIKKYNELAKKEKNK